MKKNASFRSQRWSLGRDARTMVKHASFQSSWRTRSHSKCGGRITWSEWCMKRVRRRPWLLKSRRRAESWLKGKLSRSNLNLQLLCTSDFTTLSQSKKWQESRSKAWLRVVRESNDLKQPIQPTILKSPKAQNKSCSESVKVMLLTPYMRMLTDARYKARKSERLKRLKRHKMSHRCSPQGKMTKIAQQSC